MKLHVLLAIGLAFGLIVSTFAQQKEPSLSEQDRAQIAAGGGGTTRGSSALKPISQAALQSMLDATAQELLIPGAVVLLRTPQGEFTVTYGTTQLGTKIPPTADTHFRIASNTKTMTAAVIVQLAQEGKLKSRAIRSRSTSRACPTATTSPSPSCWRCAAASTTTPMPPSSRQASTAIPTKVWTPDEVAGHRVQHPPDFPPGTAYEYSNTNYALLGLIAEKVEGKPLAQVHAGPLVRATGHEATPRSPPAPRTPSRTLLARLPVRQFLIRLRGGAAVFARHPGRGHGRDTQAQRLHEPEPFLCLGCRRRHLHRQRSRQPGSRHWLAASVFNADYQRRWLDSLRPEDPSKPDGQQYGYGIAQTALRTERAVFPRRRDARLQLVHGLRPRQSGDARRVDQPDRIARREADSQ